jgi:anti-sigma regulatory factor (Ser/Thr protein kinase)
MTLPDLPNKPLHLVYAAALSPRSTVLADVLRGHGHEVRLALSLEDALGGPEPDVWVLESVLADGCSALNLLEELRCRGRSTPVVLIDERPDFDELRRALELEIADLVLRPFDPGSLARSIARAHDSRPRFPGEERNSYRRRYPARSESVARAARELSAFLTKHQVALAHRVRIASALAEIVDNACRHAYPAGGGAVTVEVGVDRVRVSIRVEDQGKGFDARSALIDRVPGPLPAAKGAPRRQPASSGLARVVTLCEAHDVRSGSKGTLVELLFELTPARFAEEPEETLETDFLDPARARALLAALREGAASIANVAPSL